MNQIGAQREYQKTQINTSSEGKLIVMLYDGMIRYLKLTKEVIERKENNDGKTWIEDACNNLTKVQNILFYLVGCLNKREGGEIARNLNSIYWFLIDEITETNIEKNNEKIDLVLNLIVPLKEAWEEANKKVGSVK